MWAHCPCGWSGGVRPGGSLYTLIFPQVKNIGKLNQSITDFCCVSAKSRAESQRQPPGLLGGPQAANSLLYSAPQPAVSGVGAAKEGIKHRTSRDAFKGGSNPRLSPSPLQASIFVQTQRKTRNPREKVCSHVF